MKVIHPFLEDLEYSILFVFSKNVHSHYKSTPVSLPKLIKEFYHISCTLYYFVQVQAYFTFQAGSTETADWEKSYSLKIFGKERLWRTYLSGGETPRPPWLYSEAAAHKYSLKQLLWKKLQSSQESTCDRDIFSELLFFKFRGINQNKLFEEH